MLYNLWCRVPDVNAPVLWEAPHLFWLKYWPLGTPLLLDRCCMFIWWHWDRKFIGTLGRAAEITRIPLPLVFTRGTFELVSWFCSISRSYRMSEHCCVRELTVIECLTDLRRVDVAIFISVWRILALMLTPIVRPALAALPFSGVVSVRPSCEYSCSA